jgi:hypothetical protein
MRDGRLGRLRVQSWKLGTGPERILAVVLDTRGTVVDLEWDTPVDATWLPHDQCGDGGGS